jgi:hypothetical protein
MLYPIEQIKRHFRYQCSLITPIILIDRIRHDNRDQIIEGIINLLNFEQITSTTVFLSIDIDRYPLISINNGMWNEYIKSYNEPYLSTEIEGRLRNISQ